jgi:hypothetical protein
VVADVGAVVLAGAAARDVLHEADVDAVVEVVEHRADGAGLGLALGLALRPLLGLARPVGAVVDDEQHVRVVDAAVLVDREDVDVLGARLERAEHEAEGRQQGGGA